jgi:hypothetical protein
MTKQEIINLLIKDYEWAIGKVKKMDYNLIHIFLEKKGLELGVCFAALSRHEISIYYKDWVQKHGKYWTSPPECLFNKEEILQSLQTRLDILKQELQIPE